MPKKELRPAPITGSEDLTAPPSYVVGAEMGHDVPRTIRNRIVHAQPDKAGSRELRPQVLQGVSPGAMTKRELQLHMAEVKQMHQGPKQPYDRNHPGAGKAGRGDQSVCCAVLIQDPEGSRVRHGHE